MTATIAPMTPEEELADHFASQKPHVARVVQADGLIHVRVMPDRASARRWALEQALAEYKAGNLSGMTVRLA